MFPQLLQSYILFLDILPFSIQIFWNVPPFSTRFHDLLPGSMMFYHVPWHSLVMFQNVPGGSVTFPGVPWCSMSFCEFPLIFRDVPSLSITFCNLPYVVLGEGRTVVKTNGDEVLLAGSVGNVLLDNPDVSSMDLEGSLHRRILTMRGMVGSSMFCPSCPTIFCLGCFIVSVQGWSNHLSLSHLSLGSCHILLCWHSPHHHVSSISSSSGTISPAPHILLNCLGHFPSHLSPPSLPQGSSWVTQFFRILVSALSSPSCIQFLSELL